MTPIQARMARAALRLSAGTVCHVLAISRVALNNAERGDKPLGTATWARLQDLYESKGILFGPGHWVGSGQNVIRQHDMMLCALWQLLQEHAVHPSSTDLIAAWQRAQACFREGEVSG